MNTQEGIVDVIYTDEYENTKDECISILYSIVYTKDAHLKIIEDGDGTPCFVVFVDKKPNSGDIDKWFEN